MTTRKFWRFAAPLALLVSLLACQLPLPFLRPTATPSPTPTISPTPTPAPTPTPTPAPADLLSLGEEALAVSDTEGAILAFQSALAAPDDDETAAQALVGLGRAYLADESYLSAADTFGHFLERFPQAPQAQSVHFWLAEALVGAGEPLAAADHYRAYLQGNTVITAYIQEWLGDALHAAGAYADAVAAYQAAVDAAPDLSFEVGMREKMALSYAASGDYEGALAQYDAILNQAQIPEYRARIAHQKAQTLILAGRTDEGYALHREIVETYPTSAWAHPSLVVLVEAAVPVGDLIRGIVDYHAGAYEPGIAAFARYIAAHPDHNGDPLYYLGASYLEFDEPAQAESAFRELAEGYPDNIHWGDGWMGWAAALAAQGDTDEAVTTYRAFAAAAPGHARAPEALWCAAQLLETAGRRDEAAYAYEQVASTYPYSDYAAPALLRGGLQRYLLGTVDTAAADWQHLGTAYPGSPYQAAGLLWLGKAHLAAGQVPSATAAFSQAATVDPYGYYGLRAADLLRDPLADPFPPADYLPPDDPAEGQAEAEQWLADWLGLPSAEGMGELGNSLLEDPRLQRGLELWNLGRLEEGKAELEALRSETVNDPLTQYRLALLFRDIGLYRSSILAASNLIRLSPAATPANAPPFLARLAYPLAYEELVLSEALDEDLPPLLLFALIRQESLFEGFATSTAYAHGLMQVIPSTGAAIAAQLGWPPGYESEDLYRPIVSLRFGAWYLARQRDAFGGRLDVALAAYNGGPGNASTWLAAAGDDPDLFLEMVTLGETRLYLQRVREHYAIYTRLY